MSNEFVQLLGQPHIIGAWCDELFLPWRVRCGKSRLIRRGVIIFRFFFIVRRRRVEVWDVLLRFFFSPRLLIEQDTELVAPLPYHTTLFETFRAF